MATSRSFPPFLTVLTGLALAASLAMIASSSASAATVIDGPVDLGTAAPYRVAPAASITQLVVEEDAPEAVLSQFVAEGCIVQRA